MLFVLLVSLAFGQTGTEDTLMPEIPNTSLEWCLKNAELKDQLVGNPASDCTWATATSNPFHMPTIPGSISGNYHCRQIAIPGKPPAYDPGITGYEGQLVCKNPFTGVADVIYLCAMCVTSDDSSGKVDSDCRTSMYNFEKGRCLANVSRFQYRHNIGGLSPAPPLSLPIPSHCPYNNDPSCSCPYPYVGCPPPYVPPIP